MPAQLPFPAWSDSWPPLVTPEAAVEAINPGDTLWTGFLGTTPNTLCGAIAARANQLPGVRIYSMGSTFDWDQPGVAANFSFTGGFLGLSERKLLRQGVYDPIPLASFRQGQMPSGFAGPYDFAMIPISAPDADGYCSFGLAVWFSPTVMSCSRRCIGEIYEDIPRVGGARVHISRFHQVVKARGPLLYPAKPPASSDSERISESICRAVADELVSDGDTLQTGVGGLPVGVLRYLKNKRDLGFHSELIPSGVVSLVEAGVITGRCKEVHPGVVIGTQLGRLPPAELRYIDGRDGFELHEAGYVNDLRVLLRLERFVAINSALLVDLTGNAASESLGTQVYSGPGGQPTFAYAAATTYAHSIIVLPASDLKETTGQRRSRIVGALPEGSTITAHRAFVDYVVTEYGIARLSGQSLRRRVQALIAVAHPDCRAELGEQARRLYQTHL